MEAERDLVATFEGERGTAEIYEVVRTNPERPWVEEVQYEVVFRGTSQIRPSLGEASILAAELSGDTRYEATVS